MFVCLFFNPMLLNRFQFSTIMLAVLVAQIAGGIFFAINYDTMMDKGLTASMRGVKYTSLYSFWDELQKDVSQKKIGYIHEV